MVVEDGELKNPTFLDYKMPTVMDMPPTELVIIETDDPAGPFGAKGVGEAGAIPTAAAIGNAVADALGIRIYEVPMLPEVVLRAVKDEMIKE
jgi:CO/xanthine dehydrogenase Mo-binding subunit